MESGADLRSVRLAAGLTLAQVAARAKVSTTTVYHVEIERQAPSRALAKVYQAIMEELSQRPA